MITTCAGLKEVIKNKLEALQISGEDAFVVVYNVNPTKPTGYPYAIIIESGGEGIQIDTHRYERMFEFKVKLVQEVGTRFTPAQASAKRLEITDAVIKMVDEDPQLVVSEVDSVMATNVSSFSFDEITKERAIFESEFVIQCRVLVQNYS